MDLIKEITNDLHLLLDREAEVEDKFEDLFTLFQKLVIGLTQEDLTSFRNFYARFRFLLSNWPFLEQERKELEAFRLFAKKNDRRFLKPDLFPAAVEVLAILLEKVEPSEELRQLQRRVATPTPNTFTALLPIRNYELLKDLKVMVTSWEEITEKAGTRYFCLKAYDLENLEGELTIYLLQYPYTDFTYLHSLLAQGFIISCKNLIAVDGKIKTYKTGIDSLISIEPDYLLDATAIGECFNNKGANSDTFFLSKLVDSLSGIAALKGSLVGYYLDERVLNEDFDQDLVFKEGQRRNALKAAQFGQQEMLQVKREIETEQLDNIHRLVEKEGSKKLWIEPTYFSKEHGVQGRIDLLAINPNSAAKDIVELKSGRPSNLKYSIAWENHKMQVVCYSLALDSTYGKEYAGTTAVYYSKNVDNPVPLRNIVSESKEQSSVLKIRNEIVSKIYSLAARDFTTLDVIKQQGIPGLPTYSQAALLQFQKHYQPGTLATQYYCALLSFTLRELINAKVGRFANSNLEKTDHGFAGLWLDSRLTKEKNYRMLYDLTLFQVDETKAKITVNIVNDQPHSFRQGDPVIFYPKMDETYDALANHILKASIDEIDAEQLTISLFNKQTDYSFINDHPSWAIEPDLFERNYWSTIASLFNVLSCSDDKMDLLFGQREPGFADHEEFNHPALQANQNEALRNALAAQDYYLLQGPPGTGKTSTFLVNFVRESIKRDNKKIVILAFTNKAVEKICSSFGEPREGPTVPYLRFGNRQVDDSSLFDRKIEGDNPDEWKATIDAHKVFVSTVATFQNQWRLFKEFINYDTVVVDEASQLTEASLAGILTLFDKYVLIGDQKQLPAVVTQSEETCFTASPDLNNMGFSDWRISLFERLYQNAKEKTWTQAIGQLTTHYRMHEKIADLISRHYSKPLETGLDSQKCSQLYYGVPEMHLLSLLTTSRTLFVETPPDSSIKKNIKEAKVIANIIEALVDEGQVKPGDIGVITPFRAQIMEIKKCLRDRKRIRSQVTIDTVERFQGDERKVILFSTTIASPRQLNTLQSIASNDPHQTDRKLLVSISRASEQFILFGNSSVLTASSDYEVLLNQILENNGYIGSAWSEQVLQHLPNKLLYLQANT